MDYKNGWFFSPENEMGGIESEPQTDSMPAQTDSGVTGVTPAGTKKDASPNYEQMLKRREQDLNKMKSTFQKQISDLQRQHEEERRMLEAEIRNLRMSGLSDEERREYEQTLKLEEADKYRQEAETYRQKMEEIELKNNYAQFFMDMGIPSNLLVRDGELDDLVQSGWEAVQGLIQHLRSEVQRLQSSNSPNKAEEKSSSTGNNNRVLTSSGTPSGGMTWDDLIKKYGSMEAVFSKVERGELPPTIIPLR